jgi:hypothetical protein
MCGAILGRYARVYVDIKVEIVRKNRNVMANFHAVHALQERPPSKPVRPE